MILLKESKYAEDCIDSKSLGKKPSYTLYTLAGYFMKLNMNKGQIRTNIENFIRQAAPDTSILSWTDSIENAIKRAKRFPIIDIDYIPISQNELDVINSLDGVMIKKLAFTLVCLARFGLMINPDKNGWVTQDDTEIMKMANICANIRRQAHIYNKLYELGLVEFSKRIDSTSVRVTFLDDDISSNEVMQITDFRNLGWQYLRHLGHDYMICECCGITCKIKNPKSKKKQKYCPACAVNVAMQQRVNSVMRSRIAKKEQNT